MRGRAPLRDSHRQLLNAIDKKDTATAPHRSHPAARGLYALSFPPGPLGLELESVNDGAGCRVSRVLASCPNRDVVAVGDVVVSFGGGSDSSHNTMEPLSFHRALQRLQESASRSKTLLLCRDSVVFKATAAADAPTRDKSTRPHGALTVGQQNGFGIGNIAAKPGRGDVVTAILSGSKNSARGRVFAPSLSLSPSLQAAPAALDDGASGSTSGLKSVGGNYRDSSGLGGGSSSLDSDISAKFSSSASLLGQSWSGPISSAPSDRW
ncbi:unnamed protein product, partial [Phaeothamnion confervicola]